MVTVRHVQPCDRCSSEERYGVCRLIDNDAKQLAARVEDIATFSDRRRTPDLEIVLECHSFTPIRSPRR